MAAATATDEHNSSRTDARLATPSTGGQQRHEEVRLRHHPVDFAQADAAQRLDVARRALAEAPQPDRFRAFFNCRGERIDTCATLGAAAKCWSSSDAARKTSHLSKPVQDLQERPDSNWSQRTSTRFGWLGEKATRTTRGNCAPNYPARSSAQVSD